MLKNLIKYDYKWINNKAMFAYYILLFLITVSVRIWVGYNVSFYKDESYLTHTLPASKNELYNSKIIVSIVSLIIALVFIAICFLSSYIINVGFDSIKTIYNGAVAIAGKANTNLLIIGIILIIILEMLFVMFAGIFGLTLGNRSNNNKIVTKPK